MASLDPVFDPRHQPMPSGLREQELDLRVVYDAPVAHRIDFSECRTGLISDLLLQVGEGDAAAFRALMDVFYGLVHAATAQVLPAEDVESAVQRTFVNIWREAPRYRPGRATAVEWIMGQVGTATRPEPGVW